MTHDDETTFEDALSEWFAERYGADRVHRQQYQSRPRWYCDIVVELPFATLFIECESRASEIRHGIAQALGYAAADPVSGVPMVVTQPGHLETRKVDRLRQSTTVVVRQFDTEEGEFL